MRRATLTTASPPRRGRGLSVSAALIAAAMMLSRVSGFIRSSVFAYIFGVESVAADAFNAALRIPNFLQNLLGEGVLSASLIPVYSGLLHREHQRRADQVARAVLAALALVTAVVVLVGITFAAPLSKLIAPGFTGERLELTVRLVRIFFPGIGLLVMSAWCLAILNSHQKFFLSYVAPVFWNAAIISALVIFRHRPVEEIAVRLAWAAALGSFLQLLAQAIPVWRIMSPHRERAAPGLGDHVRKVLKSSVPVIFTRGVVQVSSAIDGMISSFLGIGAVTALGNATQLYQLPISLFGMAVSSAALPTMSADMAESAPDMLRHRLLTSQRMIASLVIPSVVAFLVFGDVMVAMLFQHGRFQRADTLYVWSILAGSAVGLMASTIGRLYSSGFYALGDTRTPTTFAVIRVVLVAALGYLLAVPLPPAIGIAQKWGAAGLTVSAGLAGWVEFALLRHALTGRIGSLPMSVRLLARTWIAALAGAAAGTAVRFLIPLGTGGFMLTARGLAILGVYGCSYLLVANALGVVALNELYRGLARRASR
jgi:putative peptidoglycan lipid II flippase